MREANGILTLGPGDLSLMGREKKFKDVEYKFYRYNEKTKEFYQIS